MLKIHFPALVNCTGFTPIKIFPKFTPHGIHLVKIKFKRTKIWVRPLARGLTLFLAGIFRLTSASSLALARVP